MGIEDEISERLLQGFTPNQLIEEGFSKSTVYKVYRKVKAHSMLTSPPEWLITNVIPAEPRALQGQNLSVRFYFENTSDLDIYLYRIGIWTEWMEENTWIAQETKDLVKPGQKRLFNFLVSVPKDMPLGEYSMTFGIEAQYMQRSGYFQQLQTQWSDPLVFHVKHPLSGITIFLSHSTEDLALVRQLQKQLDNYGVKVIVAEDIKEPGIELKQKFESKIRDSTILLALLTEQSVNSKWVLHETNYAMQINKPTILLKEKSMQIQSNYEWVEFSRSDPPEVLLKKIMEAIRFMHRARPDATQHLPLAPLLGVAILAFLFGLAFGSTK